MRDQVVAGILLPALDHPHGLGIGPFHGGHHGRPRPPQVDALRAAPFVEGVHRVVAGLAVEFFELLVVEVGDPPEGLVVGRKIGRAVESAPLARIGYRRIHLLRDIARHHPRIPREYGFDPQLAQTGRDAPVQVGPLGIPRLGIGTAPPFEVVHVPPGQECGSGDEPAGLLRGIAQALQQVVPDGLHTRDVEHEVDAVQRHPVDLPLPARPVPKRHRIGIGAIVQIIAQVARRLAPHGFANRRQRRGERLRKIVPRDMHPGAVLQIPVHARRDAHRRVALHDHAPRLVVEREIVGHRIGLRPEARLDPAARSPGHPFDEPVGRRTFAAPRQDACGEQKTTCCNSFHGFFKRRGPHRPTESPPPAGRSAAQRGRPPDSGGAPVRTAGFTDGRFRRRPSLGAGGCQVRPARRSSDAPAARPRPRAS